MRTIHGAIPSWPGIARRRTGVPPNALCPGHPRRPMAPQSPIPPAPYRLSTWAACKPNHVDGRDKPGHDGKRHGNQRLSKLVSGWFGTGLRRTPLNETGDVTSAALTVMTGLVPVIHVGPRSTAARFRRVAPAPPFRIHLDPGQGWPGQ